MRCPNLRTGAFEAAFLGSAGSAIVFTKAPETIMVIIGGHGVPSFLFDSHPRPLFCKAHLLRFDTVGKMCRDLAARFPYSDLEGVGERSCTINMWEAQEVRLSEQDTTEVVPNTAAHHPSRSIEWRRSPGGFSTGASSRTEWILTEADLDALCGCWQDHDGTLAIIDKNYAVTIGEDDRPSFRMALETNFRMVDRASPSDQRRPTNLICLWGVFSGSADVMHILSAVSFASDGSIDTLEWDCSITWSAPEAWKWHRVAQSAEDMCTVAAEDGHTLVGTTLDERSGFSLDEVVERGITGDEAHMLSDAVPTPKQKGWRARLTSCIQKCFKSADWHVSNGISQSCKDAVAAPKAEELNINFEVVRPEAPPKIVRDPSSSHRHSQVSANMRKDLSCPISLVLMADPVIAADLHMYDRENIEAHIKVR
jgi:hypothetical protein